MKEGKLIETVYKMIDNHIQDAERTIEYNRRNDINEDEILYCEEIISKLVELKSEIKEIKE